MEEERNEAPCFPPNYITLAQLQERWVKEQERKQIQKDKQRQERDRKHRQQHQPHQSNRKHKDTREVATHHPRNRRYQHHPKPQISHFEAVVVDDVPQMADESKQKQKLQQQKKSNWDKHKAKINDPRADGEGTGGTTLVEPEETTERVVTEKMRGIEGPRSKFRGNGVDQRGNRWVEKQKVSGNDTASSIVQDFEAFSVNGGKESYVRSREGRNGRYSSWSNGRRDSNSVWVKKREGTDAGVNGVQCSGTFNMDQGTSGRSTQRSLRQKERIGGE